MFPMTTLYLIQDFHDLGYLLLQQQQEEVMKRCVNAEPRHGELWQDISKDIANWKMKTKELLPIASSKVSVTF